MSDRVVVANTEGSGDPSLALMEDGFGISWRNFMAGSSQGRNLSLINSNGTMSVNGARIHGSGGDSNLVWDGNGLAASWTTSQTSDGTFFTLLNQSGGIWGNTLISRNGSGSSSAWNGREHGISWIERVGNGAEIWFARLTNRGIINGRPLSITQIDHFDFSYSTFLTRGIEDQNGIGWGIAWITDSGLHFALLDSAGSYVDSVQISESVRLYRVSVSVAVAENAFGISWQDDSSLYFSHVRYFDEQWIVNTTKIGETSVAGSSLAWDGDEFLLGWSAEDLQRNRQLHFARIITTTP